MKYTRKQRELVKKLYFQEVVLTEIAKKTKLSYATVEYMTENIKTFRIREMNWIIWKRCLNCKVWKILEVNYNKSWVTEKWSILYKANCKYCHNLLIKNKRKLWLINLEKSNERNKKWNKLNPWNKKRNLQARWLREDYLIKQRIRQRKVRRKATILKNLTLKKENDNT